MPAVTPEPEQFPCPICRRPVPLPTDPLPAGPPPAGPLPAKIFFPFCSDRCKLIDLGRWLDGNYQIPVEITTDPVE